MRLDLVIQIWEHLLLPFNEHIVKSALKGHRTSRTVEEDSSFIRLNRKHLPVVYYFT